MARNIKLSKPLKTHDGEVMELKLRDLTARDIATMRESPYKVIQRKDDGTVELEIRYDKMMAYLSLLSGVDDLILGDLSGTDFQSACNVVGEVWNGLGNSRSCQLSGRDARRYSDEHHDHDPRRTPLLVRHNEAEREVDG